MFSKLKKKIISSVLAITIIISNPIVSGDEVTLDVEISGVTAKNYLQGMFTKSTSDPSYFGYTQNNNGDWYKYSGSYSEEEIQLTFFSFIPQDSSWSGQLKVKNDPEDPDYTGPGEYTLRVRRYTGGSDSPTSEKSNDLLVNLSYILPTATPTPTNSPVPDPTNTPVPTTTPTKTPTPVPVATKTKTPTPKPTQTSNLADEDSDPASEENLVLGLRNEINPTSSPLIKKEGDGRKFPYFPVILIISGLLCIGGSVFVLIKNGKNN